jgi:hypothetical protein
MELATVINYGTYIIIGFFFFIGFWVGIVYWNYGRQCRGKMIAEIEHPNGEITHDLVPFIDGGRAVEVYGGTYILGKDKDEGRFPIAEEEIVKEREENEVVGNPKGKPYPIRKWWWYPDVPFLGFKWLRRKVRMESWYLNNSEPVRPFYGTINKDGFFEGTLYATASEITSMKNEAEAAGLVGQIEEARARQKTLEKTLANVPNKNVLYVGLGAAVLGIVVCAILLFIVYGGVDAIMSAWGLK